MKFGDGHTAINPLVSDNTDRRRVKNKAILPRMKHRDCLDAILLKYSALTKTQFKKNGETYPMNSIPYAAYRVLEAKLGLTSGVSLDTINREIGFIQAILAINEVIDLEQDDADNEQIIGRNVLETNN